MAGEFYHDQAYDAENSRASEGVPEFMNVNIPIPMSPDATLIAQRIIYTLTIYPCLTHSMIQVGLGNRYQPKDWRPVLEALVQSGIIIRSDISIVSPLGRYQRHTRLQLSPAILERCQKDLLSS